MAGPSESDAPITSGADLDALKFDREPSMDDLVALRARIKAGFGATAKVEIVVGDGRVTIEVRPADSHRIVVSIGHGAL